VEAFALRFAQSFSSARGSLAGLFEVAADDFGAGSNGDEPTAMFLFFAE
jgi:hypothetical protein